VRDKLMDIIREREINGERKMIFGNHRDKYYLNLNSVDAI
jgi:hypothetical protein